MKRPEKQEMPKCFTLDCLEDGGCCIHKYSLNITQIYHQNKVIDIYDKYFKDYFKDTISTLLSLKKKLDNLPSEEEIEKIMDKDIMDITNLLGRSLTDFEQRLAKMKIKIVAKAIYNRIHKEQK